MTTPPCTEPGCTMHAEHLPAGDACEVCNVVEAEDTRYRCWGCGRWACDDCAGYFGSSDPGCPDEWICCDCSDRAYRMGPTW